MYYLLNEFKNAIKNNLILIDVKDTTTEEFLCKIRCY